MEPVAVTAKLLKSNIIVDSILLGNVENNMLHGISNATGIASLKDSFLNWIPVIYLLNHASKSVKIMLHSVYAIKHFEIGLMKFKRYHPAHHCRVLFNLSAGVLLNCSFPLKSWAQTNIWADLFWRTLDDVVTQRRVFWWMLFTLYTMSLIMQLFPPLLISPPHVHIASRWLLFQTTDHQRGSEALWDWDRSVSGAEETQGKTWPVFHQWG